MTDKELINLCIFIVFIIGLSGYGIFKFTNFCLIKLLGLDVSIENSNICQGDTLYINMYVKPLITLNISQITLTVECHRTFYHEYSMFQRDKNHIEHDIMAKTETCLEGTRFNSGEPVTVNASIIVPSDGVPTKPLRDLPVIKWFMSGELIIRWYLFVTFDMNFFSAKKKIEIKVIDFYKRAIGTKQ